MYFKKRRKSKKEKSKKQNAYRKRVWYKCAICQIILLMNNNSWQTEAKEYLFF